jgi:drug/metabolite transporter (DMT)-like permease
VNILLYLTTVLIWSTTWLAITYQIGEVDPMVSVCYRFGSAAFLLLAYCRAAGHRLRFSLREHRDMAVQGVFLFSVSYWLVYLAEQYLTSGLVAVLFSLLVFLNSLNGFLILRSPVRRPVLAGGLLGLLGLGLIFWPEIEAFRWSDRELRGLALGMLSVTIASVGNILSARNQRRRLPVLQTNAFSMAYGTLVLLGLALLLDKPFGFHVSVAYVGSLLYLSLFGSILAFGAYLTLLGRVGADRAAYVTLITPVMALLVSTIFEGYSWPVHAMLGVPMVLAGNLLILRNRFSLLRIHRR